MRACFLPFLIAMSLAAASLAALVTCPDCKAQVSDRAEVCPNCGCPAEHFKPGIDLETVLKNSVLLVTAAVDGKTQGAGTASLMRFGDQPFIVTNQHVLSGQGDFSFHTASGAKLEFGDLYLFKDGDLARLAVSREQLDKLDLKPLPIDSQTPAIGRQVSVFGNSEGANVLTRLDGKILGVSGGLVEVDAEFVQGNSGSPVVDRNAKVCSVATYVTWERPDWVEKDTRFADVRRFCVRVRESPEHWKKVPFETFRRETLIQRDIENFAVLSAAIFHQGGQFAQQHSPDQVSTMFADKKYRDRIFHYVRRIRALERREGSGTVLTLLKKECRRIESDLLHCKTTLTDRKKGWSSGFLEEESKRIQYIIDQCLVAARGRKSIVGEVSAAYSQAVAGSWQEIRDGLWQLQGDLYSIRKGLQGSAASQQRAIETFRGLFRTGRVEGALFLHYLGYTPQQFPSQNELKRVEEKARGDYSLFNNARTPAQKEECLKQFQE